MEKIIEPDFNLNKHSFIGQVYSSYILVCDNMLLHLNFGKVQQ